MAADTAGPELTPPTGLTAAEVAERRARGLGNADRERTSRPVAEILRANILTRFNLILGLLLAAILAVGEPQDALFGIVLVSNSLIGIGQELRAKRTLDKLAVLTAPRVRVIRDGVPADIAVADLVSGDLVDLRAGDQVVADCVVRASESLQADRVRSRGARWLLAHHAPAPAVILAGGTNRPYRLPTITLRVPRFTI